MAGSVPDLEGYVLLDGTNRKRALSNLGFPRVMVQVLDYADYHAVQLRTWCHATRVPMREIVEAARSTTGVDITPLTPLAVSEALHAPETLAVLLDRGQRVAVVRVPGQSSSRAEQLRKIVDRYEDQMVRVDCDPEDVEEHAPALVGRPGSPGTVVVFPGFSRSQVVTMAMSGSVIPAGITRHVILGGRALRVNVPLDLLGERVDLEAANEALRAHLNSLQPRLYREPTILYDS